MTEKQALAYGKPERDLEKVRSTCNFCGVGCQVDLNIDREANRLVKVTSPPPGTTVNDGNLCVKGRFANDFIHHEDRLTEPLIRNISGQLEPATWDEALDSGGQGPHRGSSPSWRRLAGLYQLEPMHGRRELPDAKNGAGCV